MKKLLNTLYLTSPDHYLSLEGENVVVLDGEDIAGRVPLHNLESIVSFGYRGASPALMGACAEHGIDLCFLTPQGRFLARVTGKVRGNVILRKNQFEAAGDAAACCRIISSNTLKYWLAASPSRPRSSAGSVHVLIRGSVC